VIIIFEGHDKAGKSTIVKALAEELDCSVFSSNAFECFVNGGYRKTDSSNIATFSMMMASYLKAISFEGNVIFDRFHLSEIVYSEILNRKTDQAALKRADEILAGLDARIIICEKQLPGIDEYLEQNEVTEAKYVYRAMRAISDCKVMFLDTTDENLGKQLRLIRDWLEV